MIVVIDGPAGSGKSSTAQRVAKSTGFVLLDSGMMYRTVALAFLQNASPCSEPAAQEILASIHLETTFDGVHMGMRLNGRDTTQLLRTPELSALASQVAAIEAVRQFLLPLQRGLASRFGRDPGFVAEGRDMGTVVFPSADLKFFLTASTEVRARRRMVELQMQGENLAFHEVLRAIVARDQQDSMRSLAPLRQASDAILINTDDLTLDEQAERVLGYIRERTDLATR